MRIKPEQLKNHLNEKLAPFYFIFGVETLLVERSLDLIKTVAKTQNFNDKVSFDINAKFDWNKLYGEISSGSLFAEKRIVECRLTSTKLGVKGTKELVNIALSMPDDMLLIICADKVETQQQKSKWFTSLEQHGCVIQHFAVQSEHLVNWILTNMQQIGLESNPKIAQIIAFYTEGNLLASMQELQKLKIIYADGKINEDNYQAQLNQQSQYSVYSLIDAAISGDSAKVIKIYNNMCDDTSFAIQVNGSLYREIKNIIAILIDVKQNSNIEMTLQKHRVWQKRKPFIKRIIKHFSYQQMQKLLLLIGRIDRSIKGIDNLNVDDALRSILLTLSGKNQWTT